ncbi:DUF4276 family protein [Dactylosporangium sp. NPDC051541]|uniref:DUF4276 family protein n=1 Tax=Dactylosporangium sp. NPDC051541 TaxID=3363977 RepID=UPI0037A6FB1C
MSLAMIATVVEGQGEVAAVPVLLRRMIAEIAPELWVDLPRPYRVGRDSLIAPYGLERTIGALAEQGGPGTGLLVLLDADDACPATLGPQLLARVRETRPDRPGSVVLANREFEAWFLASAPSLRGHRGLANDLTLPADAERPRDCKGWLSERRVDGRPYKPTADQAALAALFDMRLARENSPSFDKLWRDVERLLREAT